MAVENHTLELLKKMQIDMRDLCDEMTSRMGRLELGIATLKTEVSSVKQDIASLKTDIALAYHTSAEQSLRYDNLSEKFNQLEKSLSPE